MANSTNQPSHSLSRSLDSFLTQFQVAMKVNKSIIISGLIYAGWGDKN